MLKTIVIVLLIAASVYFFHQLCLWLESMGYLYYKNKKANTGFLASTLEDINGMLNPAVKHTIEMKQKIATVDKLKAGDDADYSKDQLSFLTLTKIE